ncbi:hypothetical protein BDV29DRAFT_165207 [Aspergillus leporis]|uniref:Uncharacterized protein n=1 Tax=Aspergillus leporis TaxID=41062 RepID=A0A5N5XHQ7_9EURO|nr:hypothetical protein BDV29DRAFT_165207 [Aspergillus leporis]
MSEITPDKPEIANPFDQILTDCQHDPSKIQDRYESHRTTRDAHFKAKLLSPDFPGWQADEILYKLYTQAINAEKDNKNPFVDPRNNLNLYADHHHKSGNWWLISRQTSKTLRHPFGLHRRIPCT